MIPRTANIAASEGRRRSRDEAGQTSAEYVGALVLVVVLAAALTLLVGTGIGEAVLRGAARGICEVTEAAGLGGPCQAAAPGAGAEPYRPADCVVSSGESKVGGSVTLFSVRVGGEAGYVLEEKAEASGRKWYLTVKGGGSAGAEAAIGASGGTDGPDLGGGASASGHVVVRGEGSVTYRFDTRAEAERELAEIRQDVVGTPVRAAEGYLEGSFWDPPGFIPDMVPVPFGGIVGGVRNATRPPSSRPDPYETSYAAGVEGWIEGRAGGGAAYADGRVGAATVVGVRFGADAAGRDTRTLFYKVSRSAEGSAGIAFAAGFSGSAEGDTQVAVTFARSGGGWTATDLAVEQAMGLSGGVNLAGEVRDLRGLQQSLKSVAVSGSDEVGLAGVLAANYDLTDPGTRAAMSDALASVGIPVLGGRPPDPGDAAASLSRALGAYDDLSFVTYDTSKTSVGGGFKVGELIAFGAEGSYTRKESDVRSARYLTPDGWLDWVSCAG